LWYANRIWAYLRLAAELGKKTGILFQWQIAYQFRAGSGLKVGLILILGSNGLVHYKFLKANQNILKG
jgi:hypothetical protein